MERVLIVDDSATARMFIRRCLEIAGCRDATFFEASNGEEALTVLRQHEFNLVVTDLTMPVLNGEGLVKRIMASPRLNSVPVIVISSASNPAKEKELQDIGVIAILRKPVSPAVLAEVLAPFMPPEDQNI